MKPNSASLENLQDIVTPAPVSWWPPAPGWWALFVVLLVVAMVVTFRVWRTWNGNAYRRAALRALGRATTVAEIAEILKRTALAAYPRTEVAALTGPNWVKWLGQTGGVAVPAQISEALSYGVFARVDRVGVAQVAAFAADWIRHHQKATDDNERGKEV